MKALDLSNQTFGNLTAISSFTKDKKKGWNCMCSCGNTKWVPTFQLRSGNNTTCGDASHKQSIKVGHTFGKLTVKSIYRDSKNRRYMTVCECSCGVTKPNVSFRNLQRGSATHCGCSTDYSNMGLPSGESALNTLIGSYKHNADTRKLVFSLSKEECVHLFQGDCYFCGLPPSEIHHRVGQKGNYIYSGIDRIDSTKGYVVGNVASCCTACNYLKSNRTNANFINHVKRIANHLNL